MPTINSHHYPRYRQSRTPQTSRNIDYGIHPCHNHSPRHVFNQLHSLIRYKTELDFCKRNDNLFDIVLYVIIVILLISITAIHEGGFEIGLEADDIIALSVLIARYCYLVTQICYANHQTYFPRQKVPLKS
jgi:hypothetical protein